MIQLQVLSGKQAGTAIVVDRLPWTLGRGPSSSHRFEEEGVWDRHLEISYHSPEGFSLKTAPDAIACVNGERVNIVRLRPGDLVEVGSVRLRFWLSPARQRRLRFVEALTWIGLALLCAAQVGLVYALLR
jgi:pSer/pThr/pTyr-binding forkhead associated (FHA) protein